MTENWEKTTEIAKKCPKCSFRALAGPYVLKIGPRDYHHCSQHIKRVQKPYQPPLDYENKAFLNPVTNYADNPFNKDDDHPDADDPYYNSDDKDDNDNNDTDEIRRVQVQQVQQKLR